MIRTKIKVFREKDGQFRDIYGRLEGRTGNFDHDHFSADEVTAHPDKYEVVESTSPTVQAILRESAHSQHLITPADKARQLERQRLINEAQSAANVAKSLRERATRTRAELAESVGDNSRYKATVSLLGQRGFTSTAPDSLSAGYTRKDVSGAVMVAGDGSWKHGANSGKDKEELSSYLDSNFPQESFRDRTVTAFKALGLSESAAQAAADRDAPLFARAVARAVKRDMQNHKPVDPLVAVLLDPKRKW